VFEGRLADGKIAIGDTTLVTDAAASGPVTLGIRPEHFRFAGSGLAGRIDQIEPMGRETLYVAETPLGAVHILDPGTGARHAIGADVQVDFDPSDTLLFDGKTQSLIPDSNVRHVGAG
jgi:inositol-phosphate transport system ATP-binding protein